MKNIDKIKQMFMHEAVNDIDEYYNNVINNNINTWDYVIITASNDFQKESYLKELEFRKNIGRIPNNINYLVIPDPCGLRVGSGGATLNVLKEIRKIDKRSFSELKILLIHSGGDSKRVPQYSVCGKLFSPVSRTLIDGSSSSLFDEIMHSFSTVAGRLDNGMMVLSGDVLLVFNPMQVELFNIDSGAISIKECVSTGKNHGVFLTDSNSMLQEFLHKYSEENLKIKGAVNSSNNVDIDTGAIYFSGLVCEDMLSLINTKINYNKYINDDVRLNLYGDFLYPFSSNVKYDDYLLQGYEGTNVEKIKECRKVLWDLFNKYSMRIIKTSPSEFIHYGTTKELLELNNNPKYSYLNWNNNINSNIDGSINYAINTSLVINSDILEHCYIEKSIIRNSKVSNNVILSNVDINNMDIPSGYCFNTIKLQNSKFVTRVYSIGENPKSVMDCNCSFLGNNLKDVLDYYDISINTIWNSNDYSIWEGNFYIESNTPNLSFKNSLDLISIFNRTASKNEATDYFKGIRTSLKKSFNEADVNYLKEQEEKIELEIRENKIINIAKNRNNINEIVNIIKNSPNYDKQINNLLNSIKDLDYSIKYRIYLALFYSNNNYKYEDKCYDEIRKATLIESNTIIDKYNTLDRYKSEFPIRVNFGGGWSDTPPVCLEIGGSVLNGAFKLNGELPIKAEIEKIKEKQIVLKSIDLNEIRIYKSLDDLLECCNTNDSLSLLKASLQVSGIIRKEDKDISDIINRVGSGFMLSTYVMNIPKGSGLGTSSILGACTLNALYKFLNIKIEDSVLAQKTLELEQLMSTGGGWQDQIGGIVKGLKITRTLPGYIQDYRIEKIKTTKEIENFFNNRMLLIYTGQRRLAKNLLRSIMNSYISGNESTVYVVNKIKEVAETMTNSLKEHNFNKYVNLLNEHFEILKTLDKGCTNTCIDQILESIKDLIDASMICGAGGGGFLQIILKENVNKEKVKQRINEIYQDSGVKCFDVELY